MLSHLSYPRSARVCELVHHEISNLLINGLKDPRVKGVTVTRVKMSRDLKSAQVFFTAGGDEPVQQNAKKGMDSAKGFIRAVLKKKLALKYIPNLTMILDKSIEYSAHIASVLDHLEYTTNPDSDDDNQENS